MKSEFQMTDIMLKQEARRGHETIQYAGIKKRSTMLRTQSILPLLIPTIKHQFKEEVCRRSKKKKNLERESIIHTSDILSVSSIRAVQASKSKELVVTMLHNLSSSALRAASKDFDTRISITSKKYWFNGALEGK